MKLYKDCSFKNNTRVLISKKDPLVKKDDRFFKNTIALTIFKRYTLYTDSYKLYKVISISIFELYQFQISIFLMKTGILIDLMLFCENLFKFI